METFTPSRPATYLKLKWLLSLKLQRLIKLLEEEYETAEFAAPFRKLLLALNQPLRREDFELVARAIGHEVGCARTRHGEFTQLAYLLTESQDADLVWKEIAPLVSDIIYRDHSWDNTLDESCRKAPPSPSPNS